MTLPDDMQALVLNNDGFALKKSGSVLESLDPYVTLTRVGVPKPGPSQVLVKVSLASINPSDVMFIKGQYGQPRAKGQPAGFEGVGTVVAAGEAAAPLAGMRIAFATGQSGWGSWADPDQVTIVDLGNASTAGSDLNHIDHRNPYWKPASLSRFVDSSYFDLIDTPRFTSTHDCALGRRAAHVEGQDVGNTQPPSVVCRYQYACSGAGLEHPNRKPPCCSGRHRTAAGGHDVQRSIQPTPFQPLFYVVEIPVDQRLGKGIDDR